MIEKKLGRLESRWLFEDIKERAGAIDSVALRIADAFDNPRTFQPFERSAEQLLRVFC